MIERLAAFISNHPRRVAIAFTLITGFLALQLTQLKFDFTPQALFSKRASAYAYYASFFEEFGNDEAFLVVVIRGDDIFTPRGVGLLDEFTRQLEAVPELKNTKSLANAPEIRPTGNMDVSILYFFDLPLVSATDYVDLRERALQNALYRRLYISTDGKTAGVVTQLVDRIKKVDPMRDVVEEVERIIAEKQLAYPDFEIMLGGVPFVRVDMIRLLLEDQIRFIPLCFMIVVVVSFLMFRSIQGFVLPLVSVLFIVVWGLGILRLGGGQINVMTNSLPTLLVIIGVADSIHLLGRYNEEIQRGLKRKEAVYKAVRHIGVACLLTSFTTAIAFASLGVSAK